MAFNHYNPSMERVQVVVDLNNVTFDPVNFPKNNVFSSLTFEQELKLLRISWSHGMGPGISPLFLQETSQDCFCRGATHFRFQPNRDIGRSNLGGSGVRSNWLVKLSPQVDSNAVIG
ncbi:hypothetical protein C0J52_13091 [Blattella germanica]|nr:hypothetical protein C0J52_13091 [Blattella germanica]